MPAPRRRARVLYAAYVVVCLSALIWPVYPFVDGLVDARPLGLPFAFAWNVGWVVASFLALVAFDRAEHGGEGR